MLAGNAIEAYKKRKVHYCRVDPNSSNMYVRDCAPTEKSYSSTLTTGSKWHFNFLLHTPFPRYANRFKPLNHAAALRCTFAIQPLPLGGAAATLHAQPLKKRTSTKSHASGPLTFQKLSKPETSNQSNAAACSKPPKSVWKQVRTLQSSSST